MHNLFCDILVEQRSSETRNRGVHDKQEATWKRQEATWERQEKTYDTKGNEQHKKNDHSARHIKDL